jgi:branched-chain amino acid transport system permease protein
MSVTTVNDTKVPARRSQRSLVTVLALAAVALAAGAVLPLVVPSKIMLSLLAQAIFDALLATSVGFLVLQNGRVSFGQAAFFGLGGYIFGVIIARKLLTPELALLAALVVPPLLAFMLGLVIARITGVAHAMLTLAVGQAFYEVVFRWRELAKGDDGMSFDLPRSLLGMSARSLQDPAVMVVIAWTVLVLALLGITLFARSRMGQVAAAIRDNEERARFLGYSTTMPRATVYAIAALLAAVAGVMQAIYNGYIGPQMFHWSLSGSALIMAVVGGAKFIIGPAIGAIVFFYLKDFAGKAAEYWPAIVGCVLVIATLTIPRGIMGVIWDITRRWRGGR